MVTSEAEYLFLSELITMPNRELAQKIELHIWYRCPTPQPKILAAYLKALRESSSAEEFYVMAEKILEASGLEFVEHETGRFMCRTLSQNPPGYREITLEEMYKAEEQETRLL